MKYILALHNKEVLYFIKNHEIWAQTWFVCPDERQ